MPMLASTAICWPASTNGVCKARTRLPATCAARAASVSGEQHREFVAAEASHQIGRQDRALQTLADLAQQAVADLMTQGVVDLFEAIQIEQQERTLGVVAGAADGAVQAAVQRTPGSGNR